MDFQGREELIRKIDAAVRRSSVEDVTAGVQEALVEVITSGTVRLDESTQEACSDHYARRLLYKSPEHGYTVIAMIWGPEQGTPVHDHAGVWCVEGVLEGEIDVVQYDLLEEDDERCRFSRQGEVRAGVGSAGSLIPPFEYHTIANAYDDRPSVTVHVYGEELTECSIFNEMGGGGWYQREVKSLGYS